VHDNHQKAIYHLLRGADSPSYSLSVSRRPACDYVATPAIHGLIWILIQKLKLQELVGLPLA